MGPISAAAPWSTTEDENSLARCPPLSLSLAHVHINLWPGLPLPHTVENLRNIVAFIVMQFFESPCSAEETNWTWNRNVSNTQLKWITLAKIDLRRRQFGFFTESYKKSNVYSTTCLMTPLGNCDYDRLLKKWKLTLGQLDPTLTFLLRWLPKYSACGFHDNFQKIIDEVPGINSNLELSETAISDNWVRCPMSRSCLPAVEFCVRQDTTKWCLD